MTDLLDRLKSALADRYSIERELGRGGMATVYLAEDLKHHRQVAIKVLDPELARALGAERFLREVEVTAKLTHPHILTLIDSGEADGFLYYVMPYVEGETLRERMTREGQLPLDDALQLTREVAAALSYAHSRDVIHRDIKPENVLLSAGEAVVADFGIARAITEAGGAHLTETGISIGTPAYMSPEQASGEQRLDGRSDVYSLGCVLYEMLAGEPPYTGPTAQAIVAKKLSEAVPRVSVVRERVPSSVEAAIDQALAKAPADRFATAEQFMAALGPQASATTAVGPTAASPSVAHQFWPGRIVLLATLALIVIVGGVMLARRLWSPQGSAETPRLVVLPFQNLGAGEDEYFADGMTEEITARLAMLPGLSVISRQSALQYKGASRSLTDIAEELRVQFVLEGTIRWSHVDGQSRVRVTPQLIKVDGDIHVWAEVFDDDLTEVFEVQTTIAERVAEALGVALDLRTTSALGQVPTTNLEAYDYYLRAREYDDRSYGAAALQVAAGLYRRAIDLDPQFADAYALLAYNQLEIYWFGYDRSPQRIEGAKRAADSALTLSPDGPAAHVALGFYHYWGYRDYDEALRHLTLASRMRPNDPELLMGFGSVYRRQGRMEAARTAFERWVSIEPRSAIALYDLAETCHLLRDFAAAHEAVERAILLQPEFSWPPLELVSLHIGWRGDTAEAHAAARQAAAREQPPGWPQHYWWFSAALFRILGPDYASTLQRLYDAEFGGDSGASLLARGRYEEARAHLEQHVDEEPSEPRLHGQLSIAYAHLGRFTDARREAEHAVTLLPMERDAFDGAESLANLAQVHAMAGNASDAVEQLELLLSRPGRLTVNWLRLDPVWAPIRDDPRFQALLEKYADPAPVQ